MSSPRSAWLMLLVLIGSFALSQAFRSVAAIMAPPLQQDLGLTPQALGLFAGSFHFAFGSLQLFMGMGLDVYGPRRTVLAVFPLAIVGALVTALAPSFGWLVLGQVLTGIGCAPAFLACTVFIARRFEPGRFASVNGMALGIGSIGLLATGTPLAWIIEAWGWRAGFLALAACAALAWLAIWRLVGEEPRAPGEKQQRLDVAAAVRGYGELFRLPHTLGIIALALFTYAAFMALRGLWLGPLLIDRHGFSLVQSGHVALAISATGIIAPPLFGRLDPGERSRRRWIIGCTLACAALFVLMALRPGALVDVLAALLIGTLSGFITMQYADVRSAYPPRMTGRAMAVFTMAMFLGVALMQWLTGLAAAAAIELGVERYAAVLAAIAFFLGLGALLFRLLPAPPPRQDGA
ncbi:MAG: major facilitator superfamily 1 [Ramlibacter sp.]|uniref:MFS transporter n=1 Tax=Ramlibacter sp. TaxID=1917967 RepID=UPI00260C1FD1|nr:MFS transporter [Ramlibacter sp.]MDB5749976.1 major facilitator superfamily 1 [Ramlibacter sp.]